MNEVLHGDAIRAVFPVTAPKGWQFEHPTEWWSLIMPGLKGRYKARVYLNGQGSDHELRFIVWGPEGASIVCPTCSGTTRQKRIELQRGGFLVGLGLPHGRPWDPEDENGLRRCLGCHGSGKLEAVWGASNSFCRCPDIEQFLSRDTIRDKLGARGLSTQTLQETDGVLRWAEHAVKCIARQDDGWKIIGAKP